ncbi:hypothetical protein [Legionella oakridgensis]|uniref:Uncharacterized protein n=2 Tax=Legionella oakridgensis TaxID=29423 RepID=W0BDZ5_9GAMM|nr:hypothetical protein [Legionella oakridgensis]AHE66916.1 hypothetical protein Loa_01363 [Legionella oakridgensis ATCC 33761 = DSM 21215]ETO93420.1 hypothetical protein LOR_25c02110 [Legionella oakridgensis RV-2-2007]KTD37164.1 hypothetical protein Loak_2300 [Legionella oakridgensis]STY20022.1 Uncharacterised protein [Legionella longbeachae]
MFPFTIPLIDELRERIQKEIELIRQARMITDARTKLELACTLCEMNGDFSYAAEQLPLLKHKIRQVETTLDLQNALKELIHISTMNIDIDHETIESRANRYKPTFWNTCPEEKGILFVTIHAMLPSWLRPQLDEVMRSESRLSFSSWNSQPVI